jgi:hypothetical protein
MANMTSHKERDAIIEDLLARTSLPQEVVEEMVAISLGESVGDIVPVPPLSAEERRRIGLGLTMEEARERMRPRAQSPEPVEPPIVTSLDPEARAAVAALLVETTNIPPELVDQEIDAYLGGAERVAGRVVLPNERRLIGRRIAQVLQQRTVRQTAVATRSASG